MIELHAAQDECLLHVIRHGATPHNLLDPPQMQGHRIDQSLAPLGRQQADLVAAAMRTLPLAAVYASPLKRAFETAEAIATPHSLAAIATQGLLEANVGRWEDKSWPVIEATDAEAYRLFRQDPVAHGYPEGENLGEVCERVMLAVREIASRHAGQQVAVVAHSVVNRVLLGEVMQVPIARRHRVPQTNCGWSIIRWRDRRPSVLSVNEVQHLRAASNT
jgi:broad specificity phosphatase PhoE